MRRREDGVATQTIMLSLARTSLRYTRPLTLCTRSFATAPGPTLHASELDVRPPHLLTLADLSVSQIQSLISSAIAFKRHYKKNAIPLAGKVAEDVHQGEGETSAPLVSLKSLDHKTVALIFNKRSTRTRVATESAVHMLGQSARLCVLWWGEGREGDYRPAGLRAWIASEAHTTLCSEVTMCSKR